MEQQVNGIPVPALTHAVSGMKNHFFVNDLEEFDGSGIQYVVVAVPHTAGSDAVAGVARADAVIVIAGLQSDPESTIASLDLPPHSELRTLKSRGDGSFERLASYVWPEPPVYVEPEPYEGVIEDFPDTDPPTVTPEPVED